MTGLANTFTHISKNSLYLCSIACLFCKGIWGFGVQQKLVFACYT